MHVSVNVSIFVGDSIPSIFFISLAGKLWFGYYRFGLQARVFYVWHLLLLLFSNTSKQSSDELPSLWLSGTAGSKAW